MEQRVGGHITIQVSAPEHSGKTSLMVLLYHHLRGLGANVVLQKADPQIEEKLELGEEALSERLKSIDVVITEMQTYR